MCEISASFLSLLCHTSLLGLPGFSFVSRLISNTLASTYIQELKSRANPTVVGLNLAL